MTKTLSLSGPAVSTHNEHLEELMELLQLFHECESSGQLPLVNGVIHECDRMLRAYTEEKERHNTMCSGGGDHMDVGGPEADKNHVTLLPIDSPAFFSVYAGALMSLFEVTLENQETYIGDRLLDTGNKDDFLSYYQKYCRHYRKKLAVILEYACGHYEKALSLTASGDLLKPSDKDIGDSDPDAFRILSLYSDRELIKNNYFEALAYFAIYNEDGSEDASFCSCSLGSLLEKAGLEEIDKGVLAFVYRHCCDHLNTCSLLCDELQRLGISEQELTNANGNVDDGQDEEHCDEKEGGDGDLHREYHDAEENSDSGSTTDSEDTFYGVPLEYFDGDELVRVCEKLKSTKMHNASAISSLAKDFYFSVLKKAVQSRADEETKTDDEPAGDAQ